MAARRMTILGLETSCDETAAAVVTDEGVVLSSVVASQADLHARYGGVVPEVASRRHLELVAPVIRAALDDAGVSLGDVGRVGVTQGPGLVGALLVGISAAKALAWARGLPLVPVDHLRAHVATLYLAPDPLEPPFTCLLASGGHTLVLRGQGADGLRGARVDARRRGRGGVRQGGTAARARVSGRRGDRPPRAGRRSRRVHLPGRPGAGARSLLLRTEDRPPVHGPRPRAGRARAATRGPRGLVPARDRPRARGTAARSRGADRRPDGRGRRRRGGELGAPRGACPRRASRRFGSAPTTRRWWRPPRASRSPSRRPATLRSMRTRRSRGALGALAAMCVLVVGGAAGAADTARRRGGLAGPAREPAVAAARGPVGRRAPCAVARRPRPPRRGHRDRAADALVDRHGSCGAASRHRGSVVARRPGRSGAVLRPRAERLRRFGRSHASAHARARPRRRRRLPGARRVPGRGGPAQCSTPRRSARRSGRRVGARAPGRGRHAG